MWGWLRKTVFRTSKGGRGDAPQGINRSPLTTGYRGIRVGEAKNPGPGEDLDIEILECSDTGVQAGYDEEADSRRGGRSRTPPKIRTPGPHKDKSPTTRGRRATNRTRSLKPKKKET